MKKYHQSKCNQCSSQFNCMQTHCHSCLPRKEQTFNIDSMRLSSKHTSYTKLILLLVAIPILILVFWINWSEFVYAVFSNLIFLWIIQILWKFHYIKIDLRYSCLDIWRKKKCEFCSEPKNVCEFFSKSKHKIEWKTNCSDFNLKTKWTTYKYITGSAINQFISHCNRKKTG